MTCSGSLRAAALRASLMVAASTMAIATPSVAAVSIGRAGATATAHVSITIPKIAGIDVTTSVRPLVSTGSPGVAVMIFGSGDGGILIRKAPASSHGIARAAYRSEAVSSRIIAAGRSGWQQLRDDLPAQVHRTSSQDDEREITYELWHF